MTIEEVIAELERASEPSRGLDAKIWAVTTAIRDFMQFALAEGWRYAAAHHPESDEGNVAIWAEKAGERSLIQAIRPAPQFTRSIDAAMTLVPQNRNAVIKFYRDELCVAFCLPVGGGESHTWTKAPTAALALCIAALRARATASPEGPGREEMGR